MKSPVWLFEVFLTLQCKNVDVQTDGSGKTGKAEGPRAGRDVRFPLPCGSFQLIRGAGGAPSLTSVAHQPHHLRVTAVVEGQEIGSS